MNVVFPPLNMDLIEISRSRLKQYKNCLLIPLATACIGVFYKCLADFEVYLG